MRFLVIGAGAIGAYVAAHLAREHEVLLGVRSRAAKETHQVVEAMGEATASVRTILADDPVEPVDGVIVATKTGALPRIAEDWAPWLEGNVIGIQNGLQERFPSCIVEFPATRLETGQSKRTGPGGFYLPRDAPACFEALSLAGPVARVSNMDGVRWTKLIINSCATSLGAITGMELGELMRDKRARNAFRAIAREGYQVGTAEGITFEKMHGFHPRMFQTGPAFWHHFLLQVIGYKRRKHRSSSLQSKERGEATELEFLNGEISRRGAKHGIATPMNDRIMELDGEPAHARNLAKL